MNGRLNFSYKGNVLVEISVFCFNDEDTYFCTVVLVELAFHDTLDMEQELLPRIKKNWVKPFDSSLNDIDSCQV